MSRVNEFFPLNETTKLSSSPCLLPSIATTPAHQGLCFCDTTRGWNFCFRVSAFRLHLDEPGYSGSFRLPRSESHLLDRRQLPGGRCEEKQAIGDYGCKTMLSPFARRWFSTTTAPLPIRALASQEPSWELPLVTILAWTSML